MMAANVAKEEDGDGGGREEREAELHAGMRDNLDLDAAWFSPLAKHQGAVLFLSHALLNTPEQSGFLFRMPSSKEVWLMTCWHGIGKGLDGSQEQRRDQMLSTLLLEERQETPSALRLDLVPGTWTVLHDNEMHDVEKLEGLDCALVMLRQDYDTCVAGGVCPFELAEEGEFSSGDRTALLHYPEGRHLRAAMCNASQNKPGQKLGYRAEGAACGSSGAPLVALSKTQQRAVVVGVHLGKPHTSQRDHPGLKHVATSMSDIRAAMRGSDHLATVRREYGGQSGPNVHSAPAGPTLVGSQVEEVLGMLTKDLKEHGRAALGGMGGLGKTSIARAYPDQAANSYPGGVHWLDGTSDSSLVGSIRHMARDLGVAGGDAMQVQVAVRRALCKLPKWLVVVDGLDNPGPMQATLCGFFGGLEGGDVLVTTRLMSGAEVRRDGSGQANGLLADGQDVVKMPFPPKEAAVQMLEKYMGRPVEAEEAEDAQALVEAVGRLPISVAILGGALASGEVSMAGSLSDLRSTVATAVPAGEEATSLADWISTSGLPDTLEAELKELEITCFADLSDLEDDELKVLTLNRKQRKQVRQTVHNGIDAKETAGRKRALLLGIAHVSMAASLLLQTLVWLYPEKPSMPLARIVCGALCSAVKEEKEERPDEEEKQEKQEMEEDESSFALALDELTSRSLLLRGGREPAVHRVVQAALQEAMLAGSLPESVAAVNVQALLVALCHGARTIAVLDGHLFFTMLKDVEELLGCGVVTNREALWEMARLVYYFYERSPLNAMPWLPTLVNQLEVTVEDTDQGKYMLALLKSVHKLRSSERCHAIDWATEVIAAPDAGICLQLTAASLLIDAGAAQFAIPVTETATGLSDQTDPEVAYLLGQLVQYTMALEDRLRAEEEKLDGARQLGGACLAASLCQVLMTMMLADTMEEGTMTRGIAYCNELEGTLESAGLSTTSFSSILIASFRLRASVVKGDLENRVRSLIIQAKRVKSTDIRFVGLVYVYLTLVKLRAEAGAVRYVPHCLLSMIHSGMPNHTFFQVLQCSAPYLPGNLQGVVARVMITRAQARGGDPEELARAERNELQAALEELTAMDNFDL